jgi:hypothetical protein
MVRTGTTKRRPSAEATSPPPQLLASGTAFCADTSAALAIVSVSARKKFCFTQLSRERRNAGASRQTNGSKPVFVASATSTAQTLVAMSSARARPSLAWVKRSANPVRACISRISSGRSSLGRRASTAARSATRLGGSSIFSRRSTERSGPLGRIIKTVHLLNFFDDEAYRRRILIQLNRGEARHMLARAVFHGKRGELRQRYRQGQEDQLSALGLIVNVIVLWNTIYMDAALRQLRQEGLEVRDEDVARLSPLGYEHINMLGRYTFTLPQRIARGELRPLRNPALLDEAA